MTHEQDAILEKIRKLHEHAASAKEIGSEHEAQAFAAKVQQLLNDYKLSMSDVHASAPKDDEMGMTFFTWAECKLETRRVRVPWTESLANLIGRVYYCKFIIAGYSGYIGSFIGTKTDREIAVYMFCFVAGFLEKFSYREYKRYYAKAKEMGDTSDTSGYRSGFITGFIARLKERFDEELRTPVGDLDAQNRATAIVHVKRDALSKADEWMKNNVKTKQCRMSTLGLNHSGDGYRDGKKAADDLNLNRPLGNSRPHGELR